MKPINNIGLRGQINPAIILGALVAAALAIFVINAIWLPNAALNCGNLGQTAPNTSTIQVQCTTGFGLFAIASNTFFPLLVLGVIAAILVGLFRS